MGSRAVAQGVVNPSSGPLPSRGLRAKRRQGQPCAPGRPSSPHRRSSHTHTSSSHTHTGSRPSTHSWPLTGVRSMTSTQGPGALQMGRLKQSCAHSSRGGCLGAHWQTRAGEGSATKVGAGARQVVQEQGGIPDHCRPAQPALKTAGLVCTRRTHMDSVVDPARVKVLIVLPNGGIALQHPNSCWDRCKGTAGRVQTGLSACTTTSSGLPPTHLPWLAAGLCSQKALSEPVPQSAKRKQDAPPAQGRLAGRVGGCGRRALGQGHVPAMHPNLNNWMQAPLRAAPAIFIMGVL